MWTSCSTTKSKDEVTKFKKFYHNTTSKYNGYFNAQEIMTLTEQEMESAVQNNYNKILPVYASVEFDNPTSIAPQMDKAIEKVITVATIHDIGNYVDDCYVLMGKAQYLKQDYASAEETFQFFEEEFDPLNPYGREYTKAKRKSPKELKKEREEARKEKDKERKEAEKEREEKRKAEEKAKDAERKLRNERSRSGKKKKKKKYKTREERNAALEKEKAELAKKTEIPTASMTKEEREAKKVVDEAAEEARKEQERYEKEKEKLRKEEEEKQAKLQRPQGEGAIFKNRTSFYTGLYWLARTYLETERFSSARNIVERLETTSFLDEDLSKKLPAVKAHLHMKLGEHDNALIELDQAIDLEKDKTLKARYAFIKGQIYEHQDNAALAYTEYKRAKKFSPEYEMKFNAELNELKLSYKTGQTSKDNALARLDKMSADRKNNNYSDQIYFTRAQIKLNSGDVDGAINDFNEAIASSGGNKNVKLEAYYKLAELLYTQGYYAKAKKNYDEVLKQMALTDDRRRQVKRLSENLSGIARNIEIIEYQDSLLRMSRLSEEELKELARNAIVEQTVQQPDSDDPILNRESNVFVSGANRQAGFGNSSFFAYNQATVVQGIVSFKRQWGDDRIIEDNWRRSLRADAGLLDNQQAESLDPDEVEVSEEQIEDYLREVPTTDAKKSLAEGKIAGSLFNLGVLFRERLQNYDRSIEALERLEKEFPSFDKRDEALYYLYRSHQDKNNNIQANRVLNILKSEFPDSKFTQLAMDPNYSKKLRSTEATIAAYYERSYKLFDNGQYEAVLDRYNEKAELFPNDDSFDAKFDLLAAMSYGNTQGKQQYIKQLQNLIRKHKDTPEEVKANEILRFLKGDQEAFDDILYDEAQDEFTLDDDKLHYIFVVVYNKDQKQLQDIKVAMSNYNKKYHRRDNLNISDITLNPDVGSQVVIVRSFKKGKDQAMNYYKGVLNNRDEYVIRQNGIKDTEKVEFDIYAATQKNYREVIKQRSAAKYRQFFSKHYIDLN